jgi:hypothetical protein
MRHSFFSLYPKKYPVLQAWNLSSYLLSPIFMCWKHKRVRDWPNNEQSARWQLIKQTTKKKGVAKEGADGRIMDV